MPSTGPKIVTTSLPASGSRPIVQVPLQPVPLAPQIQPPSAPVTPSAVPSSALAPRIQDITASPDQLRRSPQPITAHMSRPEPLPTFDLPPPPPPIALPESAPSTPAPVSPAPAFREPSSVGPRSTPLPSTPTPSVPRGILRRSSPAQWNEGR